MTKHQNILNIYLHSFLYMIMKFWLKWPLWTKQWHINCTTEWFHLNITWLIVQTKSKCTVKKKINLRYFLANFNRPVYLRNSSVYTLNTVPKRLPPPRWVHAWSWFHWTPSVGWWSWWNPGTTVCWPLGKPSPHHLTQLLFLYDISKFLLLMKIIPAQSKTPTLFPPFPPKNSTKS